MKSNLIAVFCALIASSLAQSATKVTTFRNVDLVKEYILDYGIINRTLSDATSFCKSHNATLIKIRSQEESNWIRENVRKFQSNGWFFLGVSPVLQGRGQKIIESTKFADGTEIKYHQCFRGCVGSYPCGVIIVNLFSGEWASTDCDYKYLAICERPLAVEDVVEPIVKKWNSTVRAVDELIKDKNRNITHLISEKVKLRENVTLVMRENARLREKLNEHKQSSQRRENYLLSLLKKFVDDLVKIKNGN